MRLLVLPLALVLASCMSTGYPKDWPAMPRATACVSIAGAYKNSGEPDPKSYHRGDASDIPHLSAYLEDENKRGDPEIDTVEIAAHDSGWTFRFLHGDELVEAKEIAGPLPCRRGWLMLSSSSELSSEVIVGHHHDEVLLRKASDGTLVVNHSGGAEGLAFMFWPTVFVEDSYKRFEPR